MPKVNCREANMCVFCKHWLGKKPKIDLRTGESVVKTDYGICAMDETDQSHKSTDLCRRFQKDILYL